MVQSPAMGPPLSPRETRRSGRRSAPSASGSTSKSPDSPASESLPRTKEGTTRPTLPSNSSNNRTKRLKQEDPEEPVPTKTTHANGTNSSHGNSNGRAKRKANGKEKNPPTTDQLIESASNKLSNSNAEGTADPQDDDPEEQGITRCICGQNGMSYLTHTLISLSLFRQRKMQTQESSWFSVKPVMSGSMACAWGTSTKQTSRMNTTASNASLSVIMSF